jgi:hypothetical protein
MPRRLFKQTHHAECPDDYRLLPRLGIVEPAAAILHAPRRNQEVFHEWRWLDRDGDRLILLLVAHGAQAVEEDDLGHVKVCKRGIGEAPPDSFGHKLGGEGGDGGIVSLMRLGRNNLQRAFANARKWRTISDAARSASHPLPPFAKAFNVADKSKADSGIKPGHEDRWYLINVESVVLNHPRVLCCQSPPDECHQDDHRRCEEGKYEQKPPYKPRSGRLIADANADAAARLGCDVAPIGIG